MKLCIFLSLIFLGCGQDEQAQNRTEEPLHIEQYIDPLVKDLVADWGEDMAAFGISTDHLIYVQSINVMELDERKLGLCIKMGTSREIRIKPGLTPQVLRATLYHELGHCVLNQPHWGKYGDIMFDTLTVSEEYWVRKWDDKALIYKSKIKSEKDLKLSHDLADKE